jgi:photosystem II stability/assembly factor-like uncharacterized protein
MAKKMLMVVSVAALVVAAMANPLPERVKGLAEERASWRNVGPGGGGWIQSILWSRHAKERLFVGCDVGGFYVSEDAGRRYEMRNRGLKNMFIETIAEHPANPDIIFLGTLGGIYKTTDRGLTWQEKRNGLPPISDSRHTVPISKFVFAPDNPNTLYAAVGQPRQRKGARGQIWRSDDCGDTWRMIVRSGIDKDVDIFDLAVAADNAKHMLAATNKGIFGSEDGGETWTSSNEGLPPHLRTRHLAWSPSDPKVVYVTLMQVGVEKTWTAGVYRSDDGGRTWQARNNGLKQVAGKSGSGNNLCTWTDCIAVDPRNPDAVWTGGATWWCTGIYTTTDGGQNWKHAFPDERLGWIKFWGPTVMCLSLSPIDPSRLAYGTSGMVYTTEDSATTWKQRYSEERTDGKIAGTGLEVTCLHSVTPSIHRRGKFYLGYYDIGLLMTDDDGRTLTRTMTGVPGKFSNSCFCVAEAPDDPMTVWAGFGSWGGGGSGCVAKSTDGGQTWIACTNTASGWIDTQVRDLTVLGSKPNYHLLYASPKGLIESTDGGATWACVDPAEFPEAPRVRALAHGGGCLYAGVAGAKGEGGAVYGRAGARPSREWRRLTPVSLSIGQIKDVAVYGDRILVTARNEYRDRTFRAGGAWLSTDAGATWRKVFSDKFCDSALISGGELFVSLTDHPYHDHSVGGGVIHSRDDGATWTHLDGPGLQNWNVSALAIDPFDKQTLWLGTGGNSVFVGRADR